VTTSATKLAPIVALDVSVTDSALTVALSDGRTLAVPLAWFPRLLQASAQERAEWRLTGKGQGIHWPLLDEDISVAGLLAGIPSRESTSSLAKWQQSRQ